MEEGFINKTGSDFLIHCVLITHPGMSVGIPLRSLQIMLYTKTLD